MDKIDVDELLAEPPPLPGDPVLRTLVGLADCGELRGLEIVVNVGGQVIEGFLISAADYAANTDDIVSSGGYRMSDEVQFLIRQTLLMASPDEGDDDPYGFNRANYLHVAQPDARRAQIRPQPGDPSRFWRGPIESVDSWSVSR